MNDLSVKWLKLIFFAIVFHAIIYFVSNFQMYALYDVHVSRTTFVCVKLNKLTGSVEHILQTQDVQPTVKSPVAKPFDPDAYLSKKQTD